MQWLKERLRRREASALFPYNMDLALDLIFSRLGARDVARAACVSTAFRSAADRAPIRLALTPRTISSVQKWIAQRQRYARVVSIAAASAWILPFPIFENLDAVKITGCRVCMHALFSHVPRRLTSLVVHRLTVRDWPPCTAATFSTTQIFHKFPRIQIVRLGFMPDVLGHICIDGGPPSLEILELRGCPTVFVDGATLPPNLRELSLASPDDGVYVTHPIRGHMDLFALDCVNRALTLKMIPDKAGTVDLRMPNADVPKDVYDKLRRVAENVKLVVEFIVLDAPPPPFFKVETRRLVIDDVAFTPNENTHVRVGGVPFSSIAIPYDSDG